MRSDTPLVDVVVIGGGPAGSVAAGLLARKGHCVSLLTRPEPRHALAESLPPSCLRLFDRMGLASIIDDAGFLRSRGNTVWWGDGQAREELFPGEETGIQIDRRRFDRLLLHSAEHIGVQVSRNTVVRDVECSDGAPCTITFLSNGAPGKITARWVLDCSGRAGVLGSRVRVSEPQIETVALVGAWRKSGAWELADPTHTLVESYDDGWAWSVPVTTDVRFITVMVDRSMTSLQRSGALREMYLAEIDKTRHMRQLTQQAVLTEPNWACGATPYSASQYEWATCLLVGDAASFIDPLSSYGVKKALASAWVAAATVHTALEEPAMTSAAKEFFAEREAQVYRHFRDLTTRQYEAVANGTAVAFWTSRATTDPADLVDGHEPDIRELREDVAVLAAFEHIRQAPTVSFAPHADLQRIRKPAIHVDRIVMEDRLACAWMPGGIRYLRGVDLVTLSDIAGGHRTIPDIFEDYNRRAAPVPLPDFLGAVSVMVAKGLLVEGGRMSRNADR